MYHRYLKHEKTDTSNENHYPTKEYFKSLYWYSSALLGERNGGGRNHKFPMMTIMTPIVFVKQT